MHPTLQPCKETASKIYQNGILQAQNGILQAHHFQNTHPSWGLCTRGYAGICGGMAQMMKCVDSERLTHFQTEDEHGHGKGVMFPNFPSCFLPEMLLFSEKSTQFHRVLLRSKAKASSSSTINNVALIFWRENLVEHGTSSNTRHRKFTNVLKKKEQFKRTWHMKPTIHFQRIC